MTEIGDIPLDTSCMVHTVPLSELLHLKRCAVEHLGNLIVSGEVVRPQLSEHLLVKQAAVKLSAHVPHRDEPLQIGLIHANFAVQMYLSFSDVCIIFKKNIS